MTSKEKIIFGGARAQTPALAAPIFYVPRLNTIRHTHAHAMHDARMHAHKRAPLNA